MRKTNSLALLIFSAVLGVGAALAYDMYGISADAESIWIVVGAFVVALVLSPIIHWGKAWRDSCRR